MKSFAMMAMVCGAAAQEVLLVGPGAPALESFSGSDALGAPFGRDGTLVNVPGWMAGAQYWRVPEYDGAQNVLSFIPGKQAGATSRGAKALGVANVAPEKACGMGWAQNEFSSEDVDGLARDNICFNQIEGLPKSSWGWTNRIRQGEVFTSIPVYIGASNCEGGHHRFNIDVKYVDSTITVNLTPLEGWSLRAAHIYVGKTILPQARNGAFTGSPGAFERFVNVNDPAVQEFFNMDGGEYWFAVHVNVCPGGDSTLNEPEAPEYCPSGFYVAHYNCASAACSSGVANADLPSALVNENQWEELAPRGPIFTTPASDFRQETSVLAKLLTSPEDAPAVQGTVSYIGAFSTGCDDSLHAPPNGGGGGGGGSGSGSVGPHRVCEDFCLA